MRGRQKAREGLKVHKAFLLWNRENIWTWQRRSRARRRSDTEQGFGHHAAAGERSHVRRPTWTCCSWRRRAVSCAVSVAVSQIPIRSWVSLTCRYVFAASFSLLFVTSSSSSPSFTLTVWVKSWYGCHFRGCPFNFDMCVWHVSMRITELEQSYFSGVPQGSILGPLLLSQLIATARLQRLQNDPEGRRRLSKFRAVKDWNCCSLHFVVPRQMSRLC